MRLNDFILDEFTPNYSYGQSFYSNYLWHLFGGGLRYKILEEYFYYHGAKYPKLNSWLCMYTMHFLNEIVQAEDQKNSVDPLSDLFFFDLLANLLYEIPAFNRFMKNVIHIHEWSYQTQINPFTNRQEANWGQLYWGRIHLWGPLSICWLTGEQVMFTLGLTYELNSGYQISAAAGPQTKNFVTNPINGFVDAEKMTFSCGLFFSKDDNPLIVMTYEPEIKPASDEGKWIAGQNGPGDPHRMNEYSHKFIMNIYPGVINIGKHKVGFTFQYYKEAFYFGVSSGKWPVGFMAGTPVADKYQNVY